VQSIYSKELLSIIFDSAIDGIIVINEKGEILMANPATKKLFGYEVEEMLGNNIRMLMPAHHSSKHDGYISGYMQTGERKIIGIGREVTGLRKDGSTFPFDLSVSELNLSDNQRLFAGTIHDISVQKEAQAKVEELNNQLEEKIIERTEQLDKVVSQLLQTNTALKNEISERKKIESKLIKSKEKVQTALESERNLYKMKSRFITTTSHEFRTPLSTILSSAKLIGRYSDENSQDNRLKHIRKIESSVKNLNSILYDLLTWNKLEENKIFSRPENFNLTVLAQEVLEEVKVDSKKDQNIYFEHEGKSCHVMLDPLLIKNILINLLSNALKYSKEGQSVYLKTQIYDNELYITVKDQGIGIPEEDRKHLFERFFRANNVEAIQGTGLGLNIVKKYVELMEGTIEFESTVDKGSIFYIFLPLPIKPY
jgi:PAS domain S-box-containing protein